MTTTIQNIKRRDQTSFELIPCPFESSTTNHDQMLSLDINNTWKLLVHTFTHLDSPTFFA